MSARFERLATPARSVVLAVGVATRMAREDPALLVIQAARRAPASWRAPAARAVAARSRSGSSRDVVGRWLAGHDADARRGVSHLLGRGRVSSLVAEIAVLLDVPLTGDDIASATWARALRRRGDLSGAVAAAGSTGRLAGRLSSELSTLQAGYDLPGRASERRRARPRRSSTDVPTVLHLLTNSLPTTTSGYAVRSHAVLRAQAAAGLQVAAATRLGYPVTVGRPVVRGSDLVDGVRYHRLVPWRLAADPAARLVQHRDAARALAAQLRPDVLHTTTDHLNAVVARSLARELGIPWVYEVRGVLEDTWVASFPTEQRAAVRASERYGLLRARETELARAADRVVVLGSSVADALVARGVDRGRIVLAPNAVDAQLLTRAVEPAAARAALGLPREGFWVGTVSSLVGYEGLATLIEAVALERAAGRDVRAALVGDGVSRPELERLVADRGLGEVVLLPGRVPPAEATGWYEALDVVAVPRLDTAVTRTVVPLKPMAAMALGRPVVASDLPALAEIVGRPGAGLLTEPESARSLADALALLASDPALRASLGAAGRAFASNRTWAAIGRGYRTMYEAVA
ncbi:glycosyltransferase [Serinibacter arcticus]|uniref:D-inositol 3-phosphate glycosyltransferase n=1 Tax=Serinibacter arcticus TaxID=1655435 RepID=A0A4Z1E828_9MICO|nr:glycosyltransferase [Serinibacter arcticus]TGO06693.1 glycosyl transferase, group 1 family protein [Serinibacter arcticus]